MRVRCRIEVPVREMRFSQDNILPYFEDSKLPLVDVVQQISTGTLAAGDFPEVYVWLYCGLFFTHNNRWLWVFQQAKVEKVIAKLFYRKSTDRSGKKLMTFEYMANYRKYAHPCYCPTVIQIPTRETEDTRTRDIKEMETPHQPPNAQSKQPGTKEEQQTTTVAPSTNRPRRSWNRNLALTKLVNKN